MPQWGRFSPVLKALVEKSNRFYPHMQLVAGKKSTRVWPVFEKCLPFGNTLRTLTLFQFPTKRADELHYSSPTGLALPYADHFYFLN